MTEEEGEAAEDSQYIDEPAGGTYSLRQGTGAGGYTGTSGGGASSLGGKHGYDYISKDLLAAAEKQAAEYEPNGVIKKDSNGNKYEEVPNLSPEEKFKIALELATKKEQEEKAKAATAASEMLKKEPRPMSERSQKYFEQQTQKQRLDELKLEIERQREQRILNKEFAEEGRRQAEFELKQQKEQREREQEELTKRATFPRTAAEILIANFKAQQEAKEAEKVYSNYEFENSRTGRFISGVGKLGNGIVQTAAKVATLPGAVAQGTSDILANASKNIKINPNAVAQEFVPNENPNVQPINTSQQGPHSAYSGLGAYGPGYSEGEVLDRIGSSAGSQLGSRPDALQDIGGPSVRSQQAPIQLQG